MRQRRLAQDPQREKSVVAASSVAAAVGLTSMKLVVGILTGSLGILAEAAHSGLDLAAALMTLFAVRFASRPADRTHHYGHGKVENLSAFLEAGLLLVTAGWVVYEAIRRLLFHEGHVEVTVWSFVVMSVSIVVDVTRSRVLLRVARKVGSQALEADALHFRTDIWSSSVVILGLLGVLLSSRFGLPGWLGQADVFAALGVSVIVIWVSLRLAGETIDALLDRAPDEVLTHVEEHVRQVEGVLAVRRVRIRRAGNKYFADAVVAAPRGLTFEQTHELTERIEQTARQGAHEITPQGEFDIVVHVEPTTPPGESVPEMVQYLAQTHGVRAHDIHVWDVDGFLEVDCDVETPADMELSEAHALASRLEQAILAANPRVRRVTTHLEAPDVSVVRRQEVTRDYPALVERMCQIAAAAGHGTVGELRLYRAQAGSAADGAHPPDGQPIPPLDLVIHATFEGDAPLSQVHTRAEEMTQALRTAFPFLEVVTIHEEPGEPADGAQPFGSQAESRHL